MERTWLETIQLLGLDLQVLIILLLLAGAGLLNLTKSLGRRLGQRRLHAVPTRPLDAWPSQDWGPSH